VQNLYPRDAWCMSMRFRAPLIEPWSEAAVGD
jgi:hypothetical protein